MARLRSNFQGGGIDTQVDTTGGGSFTLHSAGCANLPVVAAPDIMALTLDPDGLHGAPEIVWVTAHTAASLDATITAAQEGSAGRIHYTDETWVHGLTSYDLGENVWTVVGAGGAPAFQNSWVNFGSTYQVAQFRRMAGGLIVIAGSVKSGTVGTAIFTLPAGYRPLADIVLPASHRTNNPAYLMITSAGVVSHDTGNNTQFGINCSFMGEQ